MWIALMAENCMQSAVYYPAAEKLLHEHYHGSGLRISLLTGQLPLSHLYEDRNRVREIHSDVTGPCNSKKLSCLGDILC